MAPADPSLADFAEGLTFFMSILTSVVKTSEYEGMQEFPDLKREMAKAQDILLKFEEFKKDIETKEAEGYVLSGPDDPLCLAIKKISDEEYGPLVDAVHETFQKEPRKMKGELKERVNFTLNFLSKHI